jgi:hypothetical protein
MVRGLDMLDQLPTLTMTACTITRLRALGQVRP